MTLIYSLKSNLLASAASFRAPFVLPTATTRRRADVSYILSNDTHLVSTSVTQQPLCEPRTWSNYNNSPESFHSFQSLNASPLRWGWMMKAVGLRRVFARFLHSVRVVPHLRGNLSRCGMFDLMLHQWGVNSDVKQQRESAHRLQMRCLMHFQRRANESIWKRWWLQKREREKDGREAAFTVTRRINRSRKTQTNTRSQTFYFKTTSLRHFLTEWNILVCCFIAPLTLNVLV